jgi:prevent-host-death family protein
LNIGKRDHPKLQASKRGTSRVEDARLNQETVNIHGAKTHLSRLVEKAAKGESLVIAKAGKPLVKVTALDTPSAGKMRRTGFLAGRFKMPNDFDRMGSAEIEKLFGVEM